MKVCRECGKGFYGKSYADWPISGKAGRMCHDCYVLDFQARRKAKEAEAEAKRCRPSCSICYGVASG